MQKIYNTYIQSRIDYCSAVYHPGSESLLKPITKAVNAFWKLCSRDTPHENFMNPRLRLILNDLVFFHNIAHGKSVIDYKTMFKTSSPISPEVIKEESKFRDKKLCIPKWRLNIARLTFSFRVRSYWNLIPKNIKLMKAAKFKPEVKKYILDNERKFLIWA